MAILMHNMRDSWTVGNVTARGMPDGVAAVQTTNCRHLSSPDCTTRHTRPQLLFMSCHSAAPFQ